MCYNNYTKKKREGKKNMITLLYKDKITNKIVSREEIFKLAKEYASNFENLLSYDNITDKLEFWDNLRPYLREDFYDELVDNYIENHKEELCQKFNLDIKIFDNIFYDNYEIIDIIYNYIYNIFDSMSLENFLNKYLPYLFDNYSLTRIWRNLDKTYQKHLYQKAYEDFIYKRFIVSAVERRDEENI